MIRIPKIDRDLARDAAALADVDVDRMGAALQRLPGHDARGSRRGLVLAFLIVLAGLAILAFLAPTVVIDVRREADARVSADVSWRILWDVVTTRRESLDRLLQVEIDKVAGGSRIILVSPRGPLRTQLIGDRHEVRDAERRLSSFLNCSFNCTPEESVVLPGASLVRWVGLGLFLLGGTLFGLGVFLTVWRALRRSPIAPAVHTD